MSALSALRHVRLARPRWSARGVIGYLAELDARHRRNLHLRELDDHMLRDIGITRADVEREVRRPFHL